jgi:hypothetical protein
MMNGGVINSAENDSNAWRFGEVQTSKDGGGFVCKEVLCTRFGLGSPRVGSINDTEWRRHIMQRRCCDKMVQLSVAV